VHHRRFGKTNLHTSEVGFGCARIGGVFQRLSRAEVIRLLQSALDEGISFFDTADMYTQGESERLLGAAFRDRRDAVILATKVGYRLPTQKQLIDRVKPLVKPLVARLGLTSQRIHAGVRGTVTHQDFSAEHLVQAVDASLRRLSTDYIDIYQLHDPPLELLREGAFVEPLERLKEQGKIRGWGVACKSASDVAACIQYPSLASIQVGYSALEQDAAVTAFPLAREHDVGVIARQVFASGLLTRPPETLQLEQIDADPLAASRKLERLRSFASIANQCGRGAAETALQFALARQDVSVVLVGISQPEQLSVAVNAMRAPRLSVDERELLVNSAQIT
jgi:aryl-alcohol dehydrogenase-like predicted oxidoreductase